MIVTNACVIARIHAFAFKSRGGSLFRARGILMETSGGVLAQRGSAPLSESFEKLFCTAGTGFLNDRFGLLIYADRHDNFSAPGEFLASFWTNPSKFCNRTGAS